MRQQLIIVFLVMASISVSGQPQNCFPWLGKYATPFENIDNNAYSFLDNRLEQVSIVGFGEDTHGTAEYTDMAASLMIYLAEKHNFRVFFIENGFGETTYLNDYINGILPNGEEILKTKISTWRYKTTQFLALLNTLKQYNTAHPDSPIQLFGIEMHYPLEEANKLNQYLRQCGFSPLAAAFDKTLYQPISDEEQGECFSAYHRVKTVLQIEKDALIAKSSPTEYAYAQLYLDIIGQYVSAINQPTEQLKHDLRDIYMEVNVSNLLEFAGTDAKAFLWAHNAHIGDWISNGIVDVLGHQLKKKYGDAYFNIATNHGTGTYLAFPYNANEIGWKLLPQSRKTIDKHTFTHCLSTLGGPNTFVALDEIRSHPKRKCAIEAPLTIMRGAGAQTYGSETTVVALGKAFDGIIYLAKSTPIQLLE